MSRARYLTPQQKYERKKALLKLIREVRAREMRDAWDRRMADRRPSWVQPDTLAEWRRTREVYNDAAQRLREFITSSLHHHNRRGYRIERNPFVR